MCILRLFPSQLFFLIFMHKIRKKRFCCACAHVDAKFSRNILMFYAYVLCAHKKAENPKILCAHKTYLFIGVSNFRYSEYLYVFLSCWQKKSLTGCKYVGKYESF